MSRTSRALPLLVVLVLLAASGGAAAVSLGAPPSAGSVGADASGAVSGSLDGAAAKAEQDAAASAKADLDAAAYAKYAADGAKPVLDKAGALRDAVPATPEAPGELPASAPEVSTGFGARVKGAFTKVGDMFGQFFSKLAPKEKAADAKAALDAKAGAAAGAGAAANAKAEAAKGLLPCQDPTACDAKALDPCPALSCVPAMPSTGEKNASKDNATACEGECAAQDPCQTRNCSEPQPKPAQPAEPAPAEPEDEPAASPRASFEHESRVEVEAAAPTPDGFFARLVQSLKAKLGL